WYVARGRAGRHRVHDHGVVQGGRVVVVPGRLVGLGGDDEHAVAVRVVGRCLRERGVVDRAERFLDHAGTVVDGVEDGVGPVVDVGDERVTDAQWFDHAVRALAQL